MKGQLVAKKISADGSDAVRIEDGLDRSIAADLDPDGATRLHVRAQSPQNEEGALDICSTLVQKLNELGGSWSAPTSPSGGERGVDCQACGNNGELLEVQVTRPAPAEFWKDLGLEGAASQVFTVPQLSDLLIETIRRKARKIALADRAALVLALDVRNTPDLGFESVVRDCQLKYHTEIASYGFSSVWIVGELPSLTYRLDQ